MDAGPGQTALGYDVAHFLGGASLVLSFALLYQARVASLPKLYAMQGILLALAAFWQGQIRHAPELYVTGVITLAAKGIIIPIALHRIVQRLAIQRSIETALGVFPSMVLGIGLVALAILAVTPAAPGAKVLTRENLALALSVVLLGLLMMITRRTALTQVVGFLSMENGLILAAIGVAGMPLVVELSVAILVLVAFVVFGVFFFRIRERFDSLDLRFLEQMDEAEH
ncbi:MAG: hydrogenase-4 component E [Acetobacteraceae bacterium]|nr:hydrogenase-4 component E [Acetobacteraceae bacterium]